jgi:hypothetical protein
VTRLGTLVAALASLAVLAVAPAAAETPVLPEDFSAADQYVESVPTSSGPKPTRKETRKRKAKEAGTGVPVPVSPAARELDGALKEVATSPHLGAPQQGLREARAEEPSVPSATVSAVDDANGGRLFWLLLALLVITGVIAGTASYRNRTRRKATGT